MLYKQFVEFIKTLYGHKKAILHEPLFCGREKNFLQEAIDSTFVSYVGQHVDQIEQKIARWVGAKHAIATTNGTSALHISLLATGVNQGEEIITQPLSFVAPCNAISYCGAKPVFIDIEEEALGLDPNKLEHFLKKHTKFENGYCYNTETNALIRACIPVHTFGMPCKIAEIIEICHQYNIVVIEDAAESLGSFYKDKHTGTFGELGIFSFNGNKIITAGGGGMVLTNCESKAKRINHLSKTAKVPGINGYVHDEIGYNYRMPNINAALLVAQFELLPQFIQAKRNLQSEYLDFFSRSEIQVLTEHKGAYSNYWLNTLIFPNSAEAEKFIRYTNDHQVMTRPAWELMPNLPMFSDCYSQDLSIAKQLQKKLVNIPSGVISSWIQ